MKIRKNDMKTKEDTMEKIEDLGVPKGHDRPEFKRKFKYRVTFKANVRGTAKPSESSFAYHDLVSARKCYRDILLAFYKGKEIEGFAICLNRFDEPKWLNAIHRETMDFGG
jgi:hypothetical protein